MMEPSKLKLNIDLYKKLYLIRSAEEIIQKYYFEDEMKTPMHMSMGGEAISAGVCHALGKNAQVTSTYRSHAVYLAMTEETDKFFAELYGKSTGMARGKAGSMHLSALDAGYIGASAVVASSIPVAVGLAFANEYEGNEKISGVFFGDGAADEGAFWESLNLACVKKLPVVFVCEDNLYAVHSPSASRRGYSSLVDIVSQFDCNVFSEKTTDVEVIYDVTRRAIDEMRKNGKPVFLDLHYYRYLEHVGVGEDFDAGYRSHEEFDEWYKVDPIKLQRDKLLKGGVSEEELSKLEEEIYVQIVKSKERAQKDPFPEIEELYKGVFAE